MESYETILAKQKAGSRSETVPAPLLRPRVNQAAESQPVKEQKVALERVSSIAEASVKESAPVYLPRPTHTTSRLFGVAHSPAARAPFAKPPITQPLSPTPQPQPKVQSVFDSLTDRQISYSNQHIKNMNYKAEMFTKDEVKRLSSGSVFMHSDGVLRYHREVLGEIRQTPLFVMEA